MNSENLVWSKVLAVVMKMPGVKVDRVAFLRKELRPYCNPSRLQMLGAVRPYTIVSEEVIDRVAKSCIKRHTALVTAASTVAGLPGGLAMAATIPADLTQYYYHVFVLSQKLAYLYGFPDFFDSQDDDSSEGEMSDMAADLLTIFMGVMMGASVADKGIADLAKAVAGNAVTRLPRVAITKAAIYPVVSQITRIVGMKLSKEGFAKGIGKFIPVAGGLFSGTLTFTTFRPGANRLRKRLKAQRVHFDDGEIDMQAYDEIKESLVKAERAEHNPYDKDVAVLQVMINMANINDEVSPAAYKLVEQKIATAKIDGDDKLELLGNIGTQHNYDPDYTLLACETDYAEEALRAMILVMKADGKITMAEKMYLSMVAKTLGVSKETVERFVTETPDGTAQDK